MIIGTASAFNITLLLFNFETYQHENATEYMRLLFAGTNFPGLTLLANSTHALYTPGLFTNLET